MLALIHAPRPRSSGTLWLLEETGAPNGARYRSIRRGDRSGSLDAGNPRPHCKAPLLKDGEDFHPEAIYAIGQHGNPSKLPEALRLREQPSQRRLLGETVFEGDFGGGADIPVLTTRRHNRVSPAGTIRAAAAGHPDRDRQLARTQHQCLAN